MRWLLFLFTFQFTFLPLFAAPPVVVSKPVSAKKRNYFWPPLYSFAVPGLDQWIRREYENGAAFSGTAVAGLGVFAAHHRKNENLDFSLTTRVDRERWQLLGLHIYSTSGFLSARHAFIDAVETRQEDFSFLTAKESDWDILKAPLNVAYFIRPTTFIPLLLLGGLIAIDTRSDRERRWSRPTGNDVFFSTAFSYGAGTGEEAFFRGFLMPVTMRWTGSGWGSNAIQATVFALAHGVNPIPWPQFLFGAYTGWLSQSQDWSLSEGVFIHTWWDIIAFLTEYSFRKPGQQVGFYLSPISITF